MTIAQFYSNSGKQTLRNFHDWRVSIYVQRSTTTLLLATTKHPGKYVLLGIDSLGRSAFLEWQPCHSFCNGILLIQSNLPQVFPMSIWSILLLLSSISIFYGNGPTYRFNIFGGYFFSANFLFVHLTISKIWHICQILPLEAILYSWYF